MRKTRLWIRLLILLALCSWGETAWGYSETHKWINDTVYNDSVLDEYFNGQLGVPLDKGKIAQTYLEKTPFELFKKAGTDEDGPWPHIRASNHFHDPLEDWEHAGYTGLPNGISSILWGQYPLLQNPPQLSSGANAEWNWQRAINDFHAGLTASTPSGREQSMAHLFANLGHLTHLVADMSVPEHTRNDFHLWSIENWCKANIKDAASPFLVFGAKHTPDWEIFAQSKGSAFGSGSLSPISNLWDSYPGKTEVDGGYNGALSTAPKLAGLADYSNFNYFSDDTVFSSKYAYPSRSGPEPYVSDVTGVVTQPGELPYIDRVIYFRSQTSDKIEVPHLAAADLLYWEWSQLQPWEQTEVAAHLDENCYQDYASNLVPRAVSYGTKLVDYFFRAKFDVTAVGNNLKVTNKSTRRASGTIAVYADDSNGMRQRVLDPQEVNLGTEEDADNIWQFVGFSGAAGVQYTLVFDGQVKNVGAESNWDRAVGGRVFPWTPPPELPSVINVGDNPHGIALTPHGEKLYVTNYSSGTVSVIDTTRGVVTTQITVGAGPVDVAVSPDGSRAYVSNESGRSVSVIDTANDTVIRTVTGLPAWPEDVAVTRDGRFVYIAHWNNVYPLTKLDVANDYSVTLLLSPLKACQGITMHPQNPEAYLTYYTFFWRKAVGVLNLGDDSLAAALAGPDLNWGTAVDTSGKYLCVASPQTNTVTVYGTSNLTRLGTVTVGSSPRGVAAGPDGRIYVANLGSDNVSMIDPGGNRVVDTIGAGDGAYDTAVSPDGRYLYVSNAFADTVSIVPLSASPGTGSPQANSAMLSLSASALPEEPLATVELTGFPPGGRIYVDGEFPRYEEYTDTGLTISFPPGNRTLLLACPGFQERMITLSVWPGEVPTLDGSLPPE